MINYVLQRATLHNIVTPFLIFKIFTFPFSVALLGYGRRAHEVKFVRRLCCNYLCIKCAYCFQNFLVNIEINDRKKIENVINPRQGFIAMLLRVCVYPSVCLPTKYVKSIEPMNFIFGGSPSCGPGKK